MSRQRLLNVIRLMSRGRHPSTPVEARFPQTVVSDLMTNNPVVAAPDMTLSHIVNQVFLSRWVSFLPVVEDGLILGTLDSQIFAGIDREHWGSMTANDVFVVPDWTKLLSANTCLTSVLDLIDRTGQRKFLVAEDRHLLGVLTMADLNRYWVQTRLHSQGDALH